MASATVPMGCGHGLTLTTGTLDLHSSHQDPLTPGQPCLCQGRRTHQVVWRSPAGNLQGAGLPGRGAGRQRGDLREKGPAQLRDGRVQGLCRKTSGLEPLQVSTRTHPRPWEEEGT